jgi:hypothetical protein
MRDSTVLVSKHFEFDMIGLSTPRAGRPIKLPGDAGIVAAEVAARHSSRN